MKFADCVLICSLILVLGGCKSAPERSAEAPAAPGPAGNYPNLSAQANELAQALGRKDYAKVMDLTYPKVIELGGGREKLLAAMTQEVKTMEAEGVDVISASAAAPSQIIRDGDAIYAVVPVITKTRASEGVFQTEGSLIAVSTDQGAHWTFADATGKDQSELKKIFPNLNKFQLPAEKPPVKLSG